MNRYSLIHMDGIIIDGFTTPARISGYMPPQLPHLILQRTI